MPLLIRKSTGPAKADLAEIAALEKEIAKLEAEEDKLKAKTTAIQEAIKKLQDKILEVGGDQLRRQSARVKDIEDQIDVMNDTYANAESKLKSAKKNMDKAVKALETAEKELSEIDVELKTIQDDVENKTERAMEVQESSAQAKAVWCNGTLIVRMHLLRGEFTPLCSQLSEKKKEELAEIKVELDSKQAIVNAIKQAKVEVENGHSDWIKLLHDNQKKAQHWTGLVAEMQRMVNRYTEGGAYGDSRLSRLTIHRCSSVAGAELELRTYDESELKRFDKEELKRELVVLEGIVKCWCPSLYHDHPLRSLQSDYPKRSPTLPC